MATYAESEVIRLRLDIQNAEEIIALRQQELQNPDLLPRQRNAKLNAIEVLQRSLAGYRAELAEAERLVAQQNNPQPQPQPAQTPSQQAVAEQAQGPTALPVQTVDAAGTVTTPTNTGPTTAETPITQADAAADENTDPPVKPLEQTQATDQYQAQQSGTPKQDPGFVYDPDTGELLPADSAAAEQVSTKVVTDPGVGANDDAGTPNATQTQAATDAQGNAANTLYSDAKIEPQPNVLDRFSSYTWSAGVYLLTPAQFEAFQTQQRKNVNGYNLLFQSGGAPINQFGPQGTGQDITPQAGVADVGESPDTTVSLNDSNRFIQDGRNPFFPNDFYIDTITFENRLQGKATMAAHSVAELKFTVIEPANITLLDCMYRAVQDMAPRGADGAVNYAAAVYLMIIRFYGYDANGVIQKVGPADGETGLTDPNAVVEKFIPFRIRFINWSVSSKLVTYEFDCAPIGQMIAGGTRRGSIPADVELSGATVKDMLAGDVIYSSAQPAAATPGAATTASADQSAAETARLNRYTQPGTQPAPAKATAAPTNKKTLRQGLIAAMNEEQQRLVKDGIYAVADEYQIEFASGAESIRDATVTKPGRKTNKSATPMAQAPSQNPSLSSPDKNSMDVTSRNFGVSAGMQMVQVIDLIIRNSNYITDQANVVINETTGQLEPNPKSNSKGFRWFTIMLQATQLAYDPKRNDFAYRVKYIIAPYTTVDFESLYFGPTQFRGVHKRYPWWFTGENIAVLDYTATFNKLYSLTVSGSSLDDSALAKQRQLQTSSMRDIAYLQYQTRSTESSQGAGTKANELAANAAEYLYNPSDNANAKVRIIGDPAWIQQGSVTGGVNARSLSYAPFEPDGTINFDTNDVLFEIVWQRPEDYNLETGVADPYSRTQKTFGERQPVQSVVYRARTIVSEFRGGKFEQVLDGTLYNFPIPEGTNTATTAAPAESADAQGRESGQGLRLERPSGTGLRADALGTTGVVADVNGRIDAARMSTAMTGGARVLPPGPLLNPGAASGQFVSLIPTASDQISAAAPPAAPTSDGSAVGVTDRDIAEAQRIQRESGDPEAITPEQVASNRRLNSAITGVFGVPKLPNRGVENEAQLMAKDT
jgi:hypothetical protein